MARNGVVTALADETQEEKLREALAHAVSSPQLAGDADLIELLTRLTEAELNGDPVQLPPHADRQYKRLRKRLYEYRESHPSRRFHIYIPRDSLRPTLRAPGLRRDNGDEGENHARLWLWLGIPAGLICVALAGLIWWRLSVQEESAIFSFGEGSEIRSFTVSADESVFVYTAQPDPSKPATLFRASFANPEPQPISNGGRHAAYPTLSPNAQQLAYWRKDSDTQNSLVLRALDGAEERTLLSLAEAQPLAWDSTGAKLLTSSSGQLLTVDLASAQSAPLLSTPAQASDSQPLPRPLHPDVAFLRQINRGDASIHFSTQGVSRPILEGLYQFRGYAWSPDGQYLYFAAEYQGEKGLWRFHPASKLVERARVGGQESHSPVIAQRIFWLDDSIERKLSSFDVASKRWTDLALPQVPLAAPVYSRDGTQWAMRIQEAGRTTFLLHPRKYTLSLSDLEVRGSAVWTLDSRNLIFPARRTGRSSLYIQALEGGLPKLLVGCPAETSSPRFNANGNWLAFLCGAELYKIPWPYDGRAPERISIDAWRALEFDAVTNSLLACGFDFRRSRIDLDSNSFERLPASLEFLDPPYLATSRREYFYASPFGALRRQTQRSAAFSPLADANPPASDTDRAITASPDGSVVYLHSRKVTNLGIQGIRLPAH